MRIDVVDQTGKKVGDAELHETLFNAPINDALVAQAVRVRMVNAKAGTASAKTRSEVRGGGRKPWKQKGTGRARQGSIRSPQWKGGGVVHGPLPYKASLSMPQAMRRAALFSVLTSKAQAQQVVVLNALNMDEAKTKTIFAMLAALNVKRTALLVLPDRMVEVERSARNIPTVSVMQTRVLHPYELLKFQTVIFLQDSLAAMERMYIPATEEVATSEAPKKKATVKKLPVEASVSEKRVSKKEGK